MAIELDPRWEWVDVPALDEMPGTAFVKRSCRHLELEPVTDVTGEQVAVLCRTCDAQLPAETVIPLLDV